MDRFYRAIRSYYGNYSDDKISSCVSRSAQRLKISKSIIIKVMESATPIIHMFIEELNSEMQMYFKLSPKLIHFIRDKHWELIGFLGEGGEADVFDIYGNERNAALVLKTNLAIDPYVNELPDNNAQMRNFETLIKFQKSNTDMGDTYVEILDIFHYPKPYSDDPIYIKYSVDDFKTRNILILEKAPYTLETYIRHVDAIDKFVELVAEKLINIFTIISSYSYTYTDIKLENIAVFPKDGHDFALKLLDLATFKKVSVDIAKKWQSESISDIRYTIEEITDIFKNTRP